ncbi:hypothetical protein [Streptomyces doebereineriae]|uniref:Uncharacterized protein n=1 Tax=Streptomyces doebereineriae TaxID=3075528 RepID=A0ABU2VDJ1_9ACTN|nr:hypothetical protein [Streptomyces sp. DSM 41640]MDT0483479.1 hypothetical protein [Streptomyces sp. DSM 41640]
MPDGREVDQAELLDVTKDEDRARSLLRALRTLSTGPDPKLREMARGVLRGDLTAQQAFTDPEYTSALFSGAAKVRRAGEQRSDAEAREAGERFGEWQQERRTEGEGEDQDTSRTAPGQQPTGPWRHSGTGGAGGLGGSRPAGGFGPR